MAFDVMGSSLQAHISSSGGILGAAVLEFTTRPTVPADACTTDTITLSNVVHATLSRCNGTRPVSCLLERALLLATSMGRPLTAFLTG